MLRRCSLGGMAGWALAGVLLQAPAWAADATGPTLSRIAASGVVQVGYIPTPGTFAFQDESGQTVGYSIDICLRVVDNIRRTLARPDLRVVFTPLQAAQRIPFLQTGRIDIECGGNTNTVARQKEVDFSYTFYTTGLRLLAQKSFTVDRSAGLAKSRIAVSRGTTAEAIVHKLVLEQQVQLLPVDNDAQGLHAVETGQAQAFAQDEILLYGLIAGSQMRDQLAVTGRYMTVEPYAFMLPKDDLPFRAVVDKTLLSLMASGALLDIYKKWFDTPRLRIPMGLQMKEDLRYPNKYGIP